MKQDQLKTYREMRDFNRTTEPFGGGSKQERGKNPRFVIHKHSSKNQHYDLRLEVDGILKSWAVPKGPSLNPRDKRLALPTEDHPIEYADFEGVIPPGEYGAGAVIVWDFGTYLNITRKEGKTLSMEDAQKEGHISFQLQGEKLRGGFALTRTSIGTDERWILVKKNDEEVDLDTDILRVEPYSALTGRTVEELAREARGGRRKQ